MRSRLKVLLVFGTRPEAIKLAPLVRALRADRRFRAIVCATGQHREMHQHVLTLFRIRPRYDLGTMRRNQSLVGSMAAILPRLEDVLRRERPDLVLVQGDTTTTLAGALAASYRGVAVGHVEAGLRTHDKGQPFPEEINRRLASHAADYHFAPTARARANLLSEGIPRRRIVVTGNTGVDALLHVKRSLAASPAKRERIRRRLPCVDPGRTVVLVTGHRRESFGEGFRNICAAIRRVAAAHPSVDVVYPVHLNPNVVGPVRKALAGITNVHLLEPLDYESFVYLMMRAALILTDSGGIQEEAPSLGKPVLVMRRTSERREALGTGLASLVGTDVEAIAAKVDSLLEDTAASVGLPAAANPFGDGRASERILAAIARWFSL